jgi:hypothetical protein
MKVRRITIGNHTYLWNRTHTHLKEYRSSPCVEKITIYLEGNKRSFLRLIFKVDDNESAEGNAKDMRWALSSMAEGTVVSRTAEFPDGEIVAVNFNRPAVLKDIINYLRNHDWHPESTTRPLEIQDAWKYLNRIPLTREPGNSVSQESLAPNTL